MLRKWHRRTHIWKSLVMAIYVLVTAGLLVHESSTRLQAQIENWVRAPEPNRLPACEESFQRREEPCQGRD